MSYLTVRRPTTGLGLVSDFDRLFDSFFAPASQQGHRRPAVDIREDENAYTIEADLPGLSEDDINVRVENDLLVLEAKTSRENDENRDGYILRERRAQSFYRSFSLPQDADAHKVDAKFNDGVLTVELQKKPDAKPRRIAIKRG